jgi:hypothetical protein
VTDDLGWYLEPGEEWPPRELRFRGALRRGAGLLRQGAGYHATRAFLEAADAAEPADRELTRGLVHLAAASYRSQHGDQAGAERQLAHARRRLSAYLPAAHDVNLAGLLAGIEERARGRV